MWKPLSIVSGVALLAAGGITYSMVRPVLIAERTQAAYAEDNKAKATKQKLEAAAATTTAEKELKEMQGSLTKAEKAKADAAAKKEEVSKLVEETTAAKVAAAKELDELDQKRKDLGGLPAMVAELKAQEAKRVEYDKQITSAKATIESSLASKATLDKQISELKRIDLWQQTGTMAPTFRSRITAVNQDWGFVTIGAGNGSSVVRQAKLDVVRGNSIVGKIVVTNVSNGSSAAEIVPGSVAPGDSILPGDQVKTGSASMPSNARPAPAAAPAPAAPKAGEPAPAKEAAPAADPFAPPADAPAAAPAPATPAAEAPVETPAAEAPMAK